MSRSIIASFKIWCVGRTPNSGTLTTNHENTIQTENDTSKPEPSLEQVTGKGCLEATFSAWTEAPPTEPGHYWLYGEDSYGAMGGHYTGSIPPETLLHYVEVRAISNGMMAVTSGRFISLKKFDAEKRQEGHIGVWQRVIHPSLPNDQEMATPREDAANTQPKQ